MQDFEKRNDGETGLVVHVHVPKTAGSTVNRYLEAALGPGADHVQRFLDGDRFGNDLVPAAWIAGHVPLPVMQCAVQARGLVARYLTALREPAAHVASHYNWLIEIGRRDPAFFAGHPEHIREIHRRIAAADNTSPRAIIANLEENARLFLNCQAHYAIGPDYANPAISYAARLDAYDVVVDSADPAAALGPILGPAALGSGVVNRSTAHFDRSVFETGTLREFLADRNRHDNALWAIAVARFRRRERIALRAAG